jgi:hypothetical protein
LVSDDDRLSPLCGTTEPIFLLIKVWEASGQVHNSASNASHETYDPHSFNHSQIVHVRNGIVSRSGQIHRLTGSLKKQFEFHQRISGGDFGIVRAISGIRSVFRNIVWWKEGAQELLCVAW